MLIPMPLHDLTQRSQSVVGSSGLAWGLSEESDGLRAWKGCCLSSDSLEHACIFSLRFVCRLLPPPTGLPEDDDEPLRQVSLSCCARRS